MILSNVLLKSSTVCMMTNSITKALSPIVSNFKIFMKDSIIKNINVGTCLNPFRKHVKIQTKLLSIPIEQKIIEETDMTILVFPSIVFSEGIVFLKNF